MRDQILLANDTVRLDLLEGLLARGWIFTVESGQWYGQDPLDQPHGPAKDLRYLMEIIAVDTLGAEPA